MDNNLEKDLNDNSYKFSEILLSFALVIAVSASFSMPSLYGVAKNMSNLSGIKMRGGLQRQNIQVGVPFVWLKNVTSKLEGKGSKVFISRKSESTWFVNASINNNLSELEKNELKIFLEHYSIDLTKTDEIHVKLTGY